MKTLKILAILLIVFFAQQANAQVYDGIMATHLFTELLFILSRVRPPPHNRESRTAAVATAYAAATGMPQLDRRSTCESSHLKGTY